MGQVIATQHGELLRSAEVYPVIMEVLPRTPTRWYRPASSFEGQRNEKVPYRGDPWATSDCWDCQAERRGGAYGGGAGADAPRQRRQQPAPPARPLHWPRAGAGRGQGVAGCQQAP